MSEGMPAGAPYTDPVGNHAAKENISLADGSTSAAPVDDTAAVGSAQRAAHQAAVWAHDVLLARSPERAATHSSLAPDNAQPTIARTSSAVSTGSQAAAAREVPSPTSHPQVPNVQDRGEFPSPARRILPQALMPVLRVASRGALPDQQPTHPGGHASHFNRAPALGPGAHGESPSPDPPALSRTPAPSLRDSREFPSLAAAVVCISRATRRPRSAPSLSPPKDGKRCDYRSRAQPGVFV